MGFTEMVHDSPFNHKFMWQAKLDLARKLLSLHPDFNSDPFASIDELLRKMPIYNTGTSVKQNLKKLFIQTRGTSALSTHWKINTFHISDIQNVQIAHQMDCSSAI